MIRPTTTSSKSPFKNTINPYNISTAGLLGSLSFDTVGI
jgi:hypothetical protein